MKRTVYYGGDILTLEGGGRAEALLVEDGVIRELGTEGGAVGLLPGRGARGPAGPHADTLLHRPAQPHHLLRADLRARIP